MGNMGALGLTASGTIEPNRFVTISGDRTAAASGANAIVQGISTSLSLSGTDDTHATAGLQVSIVSEVGKTYLVRAGGTITAGAAVKSDSTGQAVVAATTGTTAQNIAGYAVEAAASGDLFEVQFLPQQGVYPALS